MNIQACQVECNDLTKVPDCFRCPLLQRNQFHRFLSCAVQQMSGVVAWKTPESRYAAANLLCAKLAGYKTVEEFLGKKDDEWKCDAAEFAAQVVQQDKWVMESKQHWSSFNVLKFATGLTYYFSNKSAMYNQNGEMTGILFVGTVVSDAQMIHMMNALLQSDYNSVGNKIKMGIYPIGDCNNTLKLTEREEECLFYLVRGKSAKETAKILGISFRTVEVHIEQIKNKFHCHTKSEIFSTSIENGYFYRIPASFVKLKIEG